MPEYIYKIDDDESDESEVFIGWIRRHSKQLIRCKDCKYYRDGDCWHEYYTNRQIYYQSVINEPNPDDYCSRAERRKQ